MLRQMDSPSCGMGKPPNGVEVSFSLLSRVIMPFTWVH